MNEPRDPRVRALVTEMVEASPPAPSFEEIRAVEPYLAAGRPAPRRPRRSRRSWTAIGVSVAAVAGGTVFASQSIDDGANSPEAAVTRLVDALEDSDAIGVLEALPPSERRLVREPLLDVQAELTRLGLLGEDLDPDDVAGAAVDVDGDLDLRTEPLAEDVVAVHVESGARFTFDPDTFPFGDQASEVLGLEDPEPTEVDLRRALEDELVVVAVEEDGRWHASLGYTLAETMRRSDDTPRAFPRPDEAIPAVGAASPEEAVEHFLRATLRRDIRRMVGLLDPEEGEVLHAYGPLLVDVVQEELPAPPDVQVSDLRTTVSGEGGARRVVIDHATATLPPGEEEGGATSIEIDGRCLRTEYLLPGLEPQLSDSCDEDQLGDFLSTGPFGFAYEVVDRGGQWFVRPVSTVAASVVDELRRLEAGELQSDDRIGNAVLSLTLFHVWGPGLGVFTYSDGTGAAELGCYDAIGADPDDPASQMAAVRSCLAAGVADGSIPEEELRAFDCGQMLAEPVPTTVPGNDPVSAYEECIAGGG
jgi:hypothetical protein